MISRHTIRSSICKVKFSTSCEKLRIKTTSISDCDNTKYYDFNTSGKSSYGWYSCGPTVYDVAHLGHARTYVCTDILRRIIADYFHFDVKFAMGITDIDDKIINLGRSKGYTTLKEIKTMTLELEESFMNDMQVLKVRRPDAILRVTDHINDITEYIRVILDQGYAYETSDSIYFDVTAWGDEYGKLCRIHTVEEDGFTQIDSDTQKRNRKDFALWKKKKENDNEIYWPSPWGDGRPGWHIECSAMTHSYFGPYVDIHSGGIDLKFPHHTNEIAQCEAFNTACHDVKDGKKDWVDCWIHFGHLHIKGRKMSKSLKNFISIRDFLESSCASYPRSALITDFRLFCLLHKYDAAVTYSEDRMHEASLFRKKCEELNGTLRWMMKHCMKDDKHHVQVKPTPSSRELERGFQERKQLIHQALCDDFNTPKVMDLIEELIHLAMNYAETFQHRPLTISPAEPLLAIIHYIGHFVGILGLVELEKLFQVPSLVETIQGSSHQDLNALTSRDMQLIDMLVEYRSRVRSVGRNNLKSINRIEKNPEQMLQILKEIKENQACILTDCDKVRNELKEKLGIQINDMDEKSKWSCTLTRN